MTCRNIMTLGKESPQESMLSMYARWSPCQDPTAAWTLPTGSSQLPRVVGTGPCYMVLCPPTWTQDMRRTWAHTPGATSWAGTGPPVSGPRPRTQGAHAMLPPHSPAPGRWAVRSEPGCPDPSSPAGCSTESFEGLTMVTKWPINSMALTQPGTKSAHLLVFWLFNHKIVPQAGRRLFFPVRCAEGMTHLPKFTSRWAAAYFRRLSLPLTPPLPPQGLSSKHQTGRARGRWRPVCDGRDDRNRDRDRQKGEGGNC